MIFCSVVMVSSNAPRRGASPPRPLRAPPRLAIRRGDPDTSVTLSFSQWTFLAVPSLDATCSRALVIGAGHLDRPQLALEAELFDAFGGDVEVLEAPAHLLAGERLLAEPLLRGADRLDAEHGVDQSAHVED